MSGNNPIIQREDISDVIQWSLRGHGGCPGDILPVPSLLSARLTAAALSYILPLGLFGIKTESVFFSLTSLLK